MGKEKTVEFGDFQTPPALARKVCAVLRDRGLMPWSPRNIVEPTCGVGNFLVAAAEAFPDHERAFGLEVNPDYAGIARQRCARAAPRADIACLSFFEFDWPSYFAAAPDPILVVGNPPWVTNAALGALGSSNLPAKRNFQGLAGLDALTGKSNFDVSEWMILNLLGHLRGREAIVALLCKTAVARKALAHVWKSDLPLSGAQLCLVDAGEHFDAAVDACLLVCRLGADGRPASHECEVFDSLNATAASCTFGLRDGQLVANIGAYERRRHLGGSTPLQWRSGVKHDCSGVMELRRVGETLINGAGEPVDVEPDLVYPLLKCTAVAKGETATTSRAMLVPQTSIGDDTATIEWRAPKTWTYLQSKADRLAGRRSRIYAGRPPFSIFGVGPYTFAPCKVAISGLHKSLSFRHLGPINGRPVVFDDACNFLPCRSATEATFWAALLNSAPAQEFFESIVFWDAKRPVTVDLLRRLDLRALATSAGLEREADHYLFQSDNPVPAQSAAPAHQLSLF